MSIDNSTYVYFLANFAKYYCWFENGIIFARFVTTSSILLGVANQSQRTLTLLSINILLIHILKMVFGNFPGKAKCFSRELWKTNSRNSREIGNSQEQALPQKIHLVPTEFWKLDFLQKWQKKLPPGNSGQESKNEYKY